MWYGELTARTTCPLPKCCPTPAIVFRVQLPCSSTRMAEAGTPSRISAARIASASDSGPGFPPLHTIKGARPSK